MVTSIIQPIDTLEDAIFRNTIDINALGNRVRNQLVENLHIARDRLIAKLETLPEAAVYTRRFNQRMLAEINGTVIKLNKDGTALMETNRAALAEAEQKSVTAALLKETDQFNPNVRIPISPASKVLKKRLKGKTIEQWIATGNRDLVKGLKIALTQAVIVGASIGQTVSILRNQFGLGRQRANIIAKTQLFEAAADARNEVYKKFRTLARGWKRFETLDQRTCIVCGVLDGKIVKQKPANIGPIHFLCRGHWLMLTKFSQDKFADEIKRPAIIEQSKRTIHHKDGSTSTKWTIEKVKLVKGKQRYQEFFERQPVKWQKETLGPGKFKIFKAEDLQLEDLINNTRELTLEEITAKFGAAA